jgi:hypothetical protein
MIRIDIFTSDYPTAHKAYAVSSYNVSAIYCKGSKEEIELQRSATINAIEAVNDLAGIHIRYEITEIDD